MQISKSAPLFSLHELYNPSSSLIQTFKLLAFFCDYTGRFVSELVANPEDRFSHITTQISYCENCDNVFYVVCYVFSFACCYSR